MPDRQCFFVQNAKHLVGMIMIGCELHRISHVLNARHTGLVTRGQGENNLALKHISMNTIINFLSENFIQYEKHYVNHIYYKPCK